MRRPSSETQIASRGRCAWRIMPPDPLSALAAAIASDVAAARTEPRARVRLALETHAAAHALALLELAAAEGRLRVDVRVGKWGDVIVRAVVDPVIGR